MKPNKIHTSPEQVRLISSFREEWIETWNEEEKEFAQKFNLFF
ncbi:hypothetical protein LEP1GSC073_2058 [Leptospira noguchii str. Cascata]|nr:hypothetical protein LEP1GSC073_2058 [Leptospira noguchii str. Cascata]